MSMNQLVISVGSIQEQFGSNLRSIIELVSMAYRVGTRLKKDWHQFGANLWVPDHSQSIESEKPRVVQDGTIVWSQLPTDWNGTCILACVARWTGQAPVLNKIYLHQTAQYLVDPLQSTLHLFDSPKGMERIYLHMLVPQPPSTLVLLSILLGFQLFLNFSNSPASACQGHQGCGFWKPFAFQQSSVML